MHCSRPFRRLAITLIPAAALSLGLSAVLAQTPPATPPGAAAPATPAPPAAETQMQQQPAAPETTPMTPEAAQPPVGGSALP